MSTDEATYSPSGPGRGSRHGRTSPLDPTQRLRIGYLLTLAGGALDAYTYIARGGVFANAQTGNIVLLALSVVELNAMRVLSYLVPIVAFVAGLFAVLRLERRLDTLGKRFARRFYLGIEIAVLCAVALLPASSACNPLANALVSFVAAMQYESFKSFSGMAFTTTMTTGNLRKFVESAFAARAEGSPVAHAQSHVFGIAIAMFVTGAMLGALAARALGQFGCVLTMALLGLAIAIITIDKRPR